MVCDLVRVVAVALCLSLAAGTAAAPAAAQTGDGTAAPAATAQPADAAPPAPAPAQPAGSAASPTAESTTGSPVSASALTSPAESTAAAPAGTAPVAAARDRASPLAPADTSNPRATFESVLDNVYAAYRAAISEDRAEAVRALHRAMSTLDLSAVPPRFVDDRGAEAAIMLKEIFDRLEPPAADTIPGPGTDVTRWRVPGTEITIARMESGPRTGEYLFTADTVARIGDFYALVRALPYREGDTVTPFILDRYRATPGSGLSVFWGRMIPPWGREFVAGAAVWQWIATVLVLALTALAIAGLLALGRAIAARVKASGEDRAATEPDAHIDAHMGEPGNPVAFPPANRSRFGIAMMMAVAACAALTFLTQWVLDDIVNLTGSAMETVTFLLDLLGYVFLGWLAVLVIFAVAETYIALRGLNPRAATGRLARLAAAGISVVAVVALFVHAGNGFGIPAYSIVTGLGVGGIAIGFGAQTLVRDVFSGIFFLVDDAFRPGEYIDVGTAKGFVEAVSVRSVQLRHHNGPLQTIPFGEIKRVNNFSRDWVVMKLTFRIPFEEDAERVRKLINKLGREMKEDPVLGPQFMEPLKSQGVMEIDDFGQMMRIKFMTKPGEQFTLRRTVWQKVRELFEKEGIEFAGREVRVRGEEGAAQALELTTDEKKPAAA